MDFDLFLVDLTLFSAVTYMIWHIAIKNKKPECAKTCKASSSQKTTPATVALGGSLKRGVSLARLRVAENQK